MKILDTIALLLVIIGAINWGLIGFFQFDLVAAIFGDMSTFSRIIYSLIGIAGLYSISFPRTFNNHAISSRDVSSTLSISSIIIHFLSHEILSRREMPPKHSTSMVAIGVAGI